MPIQAAADYFLTISNVYQSYQKFVSNIVEL